VDLHRDTGVLRKFGNPIALRHRPATLVGLLCAVNACASVQREGPSIQDRRWTAYLGGETRSGPGTDTVAPDLQPAWTVRVGRGVVGAPAAGETVLAFALTDRSVVLVDRATGQPYWSRRLDQAAGAGPLLYDDRLLVAEQGLGGSVRALRLSDAHQLWSQRAGDIAVPLAIMGDAVVAGSVEGFVSVLAIGDGSLRWRYRLHGAVRAPPVPVPGGVLVATAADTLYFLADSDGAIVRRRPTRGTVLAAPALAEGTLVYGTSDGWLEAVDATSLRPRWSLALDAPVVGSVAIRGGMVYATSARGRLVAIPLGGPVEAARSVETGLVMRAGPMPLPGGVVVCGVNGEIVRLGPQLDRQWSARVELPVSEPVLVDQQTMLAVSEHGDVVLYR